MVTAVCLECVEDKHLKEIILNDNSGKNLDTRSMSNGIYYLEFENERMRVIKKVVVIH